MLDKLTLGSPQRIDPEKLCRNLEGRYSKLTSTSTKYHEMVLVFHDGPGRKPPHLLTVHLDPRQPNVCQSKLELNPGRIGSFETVRSLVGLVFEDPNSLKISRLDHAVDIPVDFDRVHRSLIYSRKKKREVYRNGADISGFYIGAYPELLVVYDKAKEQKIPGPLTRIELRQHKAKTPVSEFALLRELRVFSPFDSLRFIRVKDMDDPHLLRGGYKAQILRDAIATFGSQGALKTFNQHQNFNRDFKALLETETEIPDLDAIYQANLNVFFEGGIG